MKTFRVFDKTLLRMANKIAIKRGYNRAIVEEYIEKQPSDAIWVVTLSLLHEHAAGKAVDPHVRCMIRQLFTEDAPTLFVDTDMELFERLPTVNVPEINPEPQKA